MATKLFVDLFDLLQTPRTSRSQQIRYGECDELEVIAFVLAGCFIGFTYVPGYARSLLEKGNQINEVVG